MVCGQEKKKDYIDQATKYLNELLESLKTKKAEEKFKLNETLSLLITFAKEVQILMAVISDSSHALFINNY